MDRHKYIPCEVCLKSLRSDKIRAHLKQHGGGSKYPMKTCPVCQKTMIAWHLARHQKAHKKLVNDILENIKADQSNFNEIEQTGEILRDLLVKEDVNPKSLRKEYVKALEVYSCKGQNNSEILKSWQEKLLELMQPSHRSIIWVVGKMGNEGKSWFQRYIEQHFGVKRVFQSSADRSSEPILHTLSKRTLALMDIFVFNIPRSFDKRYVPYTLFEKIKDGQAISTKYDSKVLSFKTPNILMVFSNEEPCTTQVSIDRWTIYKIVNDELVIV